MNAFDTYFQFDQGKVPLPDWGAIDLAVEAEGSAETDSHEIWEELAVTWAVAVAKGYGHETRYLVYQSRHFVLLAVCDRRKAKEVLGFLERCLESIRKLLGELATPNLIGKCPVFAFEHQGQYYHYLSHYDSSEGESGGSGGVYINRGYGHFALPGAELNYYVRVMSHELCHSQLSHLELPVWLDEALTAEVEQAIAGGNPYEFDREWAERHQDYWTEASIQDFWSGKAFWYPDEGQELSYHLARYLLHGLRAASSNAAVREFALSANYDDAGHAAALDLLGIDLADALSGLLGPGEWAPMPESP